MTRFEKIRMIKEKDLEKRILETKPCLQTLKPPTLCLQPAPNHADSQNPNLVMSPSCETRMPQHSHVPTPPKLPTL